MALRQDLEQARRLLAHQTPRHLLPDPFRHKRVSLAELNHFAAKVNGLWRNLKLKKPGCKSREAQNAHRILFKGRTDVPEHLIAQVPSTAQRIDQIASQASSHGVHSQIPTLEIIFQRDIGARIEGETLVALARLALGACQRILLFGLGM